MEIPIPKEWIDAVVRIIRTGTKDREILITLSATQEWEAATSAWSHDLFDSIEKALAHQGVTGKPIYGLADPGDTYAFWIYYDDIQLYAKVCLLEGKLKIKVISAHRPRKGFDIL